MRAASSLFYKPHEYQDAGDSEAFRYGDNHSEDRGEIPTPLKVNEESSSERPHHPLLCAVPFGIIEIINGSWNGAKKERKRRPFDEMPRQKADKDGSEADSRADFIESTPSISPRFSADKSKDNTGTYDVGETQYETTAFCRRIDKPADIRPEEDEV